MGEWSRERWVEALRGAPEQREEAARELRAFLYRSALKMTGGNESLADDCVQDALVRVIRNLAGFRGEAMITTWAYSILTNVYRDRLRRGARVEPRPEPEAGGNPGAERATQDDARRLELREGLRICLAKLSTPQRSAFLKRHLGLATEEISASLDTTNAYVYKLLSQATRALRACMEQAGWGMHVFL